ncbi:type I-E CRISPR-associated protein Cse2/CasB [Kitasatospora sp. NPDC056076]|uniref:type I-E CRISPR-associated protein Cse2/CasB n=1 Tax=Kitasatospora sp. NPDC056076 TaxID=3345703 RepID=UPI0035DAC950
MTTTAPTPLVTLEDRAAAFARDLARVVHSRDISTLNALTQWGRIPTWTPRTVNVVRHATADEFEAFSLAAMCFAQFHRSADSMHPGRPGTSIGRAARQIGSKKTGYGPQFGPAVDAFTRCLTAPTLTDLVEPLRALMARIPSDGHPPHWITLAIDLTNLGGAGADTVRLAWSRDFHTNRSTQDKDTQS